MRLLRFISTMAWPYDRVVFGLLVLYISLQLCLCADPCKSYKTLQHDKRALSYQSKPTETEECDRYLPYGTNWYRIDGNTGSDLVSQCPDVGQCGTLFPIWLNGSIPSKSEGIVTRTACQRGLLDEACCETKINIQLKNCGSFRVAYLRTLQGCPGKYCFEYKELCPPDQSSESGYMPCTTSFAHLNSRATARVEPFVNASDASRPDERRLFFHCRRIADGSSSSYLFDVNWYIDGNLSKTISNVPRDRYDSDTAFGEDTSWRLPMMVNCSYRARSYRGGVPSPPVMSDEFFAGIKVSPAGVIQVREGSTGTVYFQSTIPVPCVTQFKGHPYVASCEIHFENGVNETHEGCTVTGSPTASIQLSHDCGFKFNGKTWNSRQSMAIQAFSDGTTRNPRNPALIRLSTSPIIKLFPLWQNYKLPEIKVMTGDRNRETMRKYCRSYSDVNIQTFDGRYYTTNNPGRYLLYKHNDKPIEVMTLTERGLGTVNCAISVKAGNDVYIIYTCQNKNIVKRMGCETDSNLDVYVNQQSKNTQIILPTGTKVEIQYSHWAGVYFLRIHIYPSPDDFGKVTGLCGDLDGSRLDESKSLGPQFRLGDLMDSSAFIQAVSGSFPVNHQICLCPPPNRVHPILTNAVSCSWRTGVSCSRMKWNVKPCQNRQKRDAHLDENDWKSEDLEHEKNFLREKRVVRSTWTLPAARDKCLKVFEQYASFNKCRELSGVDVKSVLDVCAADVVRIGETGWIPQALEVIKSQCINILDVDVDLWTPTSPGAPSRGEVIFTEAKCPSECNDNGHCVKGICQCKPDFVEEDCSVNLKIPPKVERLTRNGVCDLSNPNTSCSATHVFGANFYESSGLICRVKEIMIDETGMKLDSTSTTHQAVFENFRQIMCTFPDKKTFSIPHDAIGVHGYHVEVSNNGAIYSTSLTFVASDPRCHQCDLNNMTCSRKADSCLIEGKCYTSGEAKLSEPHMKCTPTVSGFKWTQEIIKSQAVRLVGGKSEMEGRIELLHNGKWGTICSFAFDDIDATVICKMLGFDDKPGNSKALKNFGGGTGPIWFDDPECKGTEADIADCPRMFKTTVPVWGIINCQHNEDAGVRCVSRSSNPMIIG